MLTNRIIKHNNFFYCWFNNDCLRYKTKGSCVKAVSNKDRISYQEASVLVNRLLSVEDYSSLKERVSNLESNKLDVLILKNNLESSLEKIDQKLNTIRKKATKYLTDNGISSFKFDATYNRDGKTIVKNGVSSLFPSIKLSKQYTIDTYIVLMNEVYDFIQNQVNEESKDAFIRRLKRKNKEYSTYMMEDDLFIHQIGSLFF